MPIDTIEAEIETFLHGNAGLASGQIEQLLCGLYGELYVEGMDDEQIYQQIDLGLTGRVLEERVDLFERDDFSDEEDDDREEEDKEAEEDEEKEDESEIEEEDEEEEEIDQPNAKRAKFDLGEDEDDNELNDDELEAKASKTYQKTQLDDEFFSLRQMEEACEQQEEQGADEAVLDEDMMEELYGDGMEGDEDDEEDGGLFGDDNGDDNDDEGNKNGIMASDFFAPSTFEKRTQRVREELDELEADQIKDKPWHLMGETTARQRDGDELLAMDVDYDAIKPAVAPTVQMTEELENIIIQRIRDKAYDDVERKTREMVEPAQAMRKLVPDEERKSLSALYEQEFLSQNNKDADEDPVRKEMKANMERLFNQLDFLTYDTVVNQKEVEIKVVSGGTAALVSEEKGPSLVSQYQSLAPEEIGGRSKGAFKIKEERSAGEIKRDRRAIKQKIKAKKAAGIEIKFKNPKKKSDADLRPDDGKKTKWTNSSKVFRLLQEENETGALTAKAEKKAKKTEVMEKRRAKSFKL